jgi:TPR repeat protein
MRSALPTLLGLLLWTAPAAFPAPGQDANTPTVVAGSDGNSYTKSTPPSSNSIVFQETKARAEKGDAVAQTELGLMYRDGKGAPQDYGEAVKWYRKAAEQDNAQGQSKLGGMYARGWGVPQDYVEGVKWYRRAADQGYAPAQNVLGHCYEFGHGVAQGYAEAVKWYRKAAEQGNADAQCNLGVMYVRGQGVSQDYSEAVKWYRKAADQDDLRAQSNLGWCYDKGEGVPQNAVEAVKWYRKAADLGYPNATNAGNAILDRIADYIKFPSVSDGSSPSYAAGFEVGFVSGHDVAGKGIERWTDTVIERTAWFLVPDAEEKATKDWVAGYVRGWPRGYESH